LAYEQKCNFLKKTENAKLECTFYVLTKNHLLLRWPRNLAQVNVAVERVSHFNELFRRNLWECHHKSSRLLQKNITIVILQIIRFS